MTGKSIKSKNKCVCLEFIRGLMRGHFFPFKRRGVGLLGRIYCTKSSGQLKFNFSIQKGYRMNYRLSSTFITPLVSKLPNTFSTRFERQS